MPVAEFGKWAINHFYPDRAIGDKLINELRSAKQNGHIYIWAKHREETAGYLKIGIRKVYIHDYRSSILTPLHTAIIYDTYVVDKFRCKGIASNLICDGMRLMRQKGYLRIRCHIPPSNTASVRAYEKCGFHSKAHIRFHRIMGRSFFSSNNNAFSQSTLPGCLHWNRLVSSRRWRGSLLWSLRLRIGFSCNTSVHRAMHQRVCWGRTGDG